jgi:hypothetical protein
VAAAASLVDWPVDDVDDLRLATDELCLSLLRAPGPLDRRLNIKLIWDPQVIEVQCSAFMAAAAAGSGPVTNGAADDGVAGDGVADDGVGSRSGLSDELSQRVLAALVDEHGTYSEGGRVVAWLRKRLVRVGHRP